MSSIAIYTFIQNESQFPAQPFNAAKWKANGFDYICFIPHKGDLPDFNGAWYVEELPVSWKDERLNAVMPKLNPQSVLEGYRYSLWIDSNVVIKDDSFYEYMKSLQEKGILYADLMDTSHKSVYGYAREVYRKGQEPFKVILKAVMFLLLKGVGRSAGFHDTSIMLRAHEDDSVLEFDRWWWECLLERAGGHYDRLMHVFALKDTPSLRWDFLDAEVLAMCISRS